jgi:peroxiredoxin
MKVLTVVVVGAVLVLGAVTAPAAEVGQAAPAFTLTDVKGTTHNLADFKGKVVVLEWTNYDCPFVKKHYGTRNMQKLQETYTGKGVVWLSICSSAAGKQGHYAPEVWQKKTAEQGSRATAVLLDADGTVGRAYGAKTTPNMFVIGTDGKLVYAGAIDDNASWDPKTVKDADNYVAAALDALLAGKPVEVAETKPYGCSVKY